ncbi:MAG: hypothetical protein IJC67_03215 [Clostridia bacterium]|nr:hypothetical protein [Clostridia bacterium]
MKKFFALLLCLVFVLSVCGCATQEVEPLAYKEISFIPPNTWEVESDGTSIYCYPPSSGFMIITSTPLGILDEEFINNENLCIAFFEGVTGGFDDVVFSDFANDLVAGQTAASAKYTFTYEGNEFDGTISAFIYNDTVYVSAFNAGNIYFNGSLPYYEQALETITIN